MRMKEANLIAKIKLITILSVGILLLFTPKIVDAASITSISPITVKPGETTLTINGSGFGTEKGYVCFVCPNLSIDVQSSFNHSLSTLHNLIQE